MLAIPRHTGPPQIRLHQWSATETSITGMQRLQLRASLEASQQSIRVSNGARLLSFTTVLRARYKWWTKRVTSVLSRQLTNQLKKWLMTNCKELTQACLTALTLLFSIAWQTCLTTLSKSTMPGSTATTLRNLSTTPWCSKIPLSNTSSSIDCKTHKAEKVDKACSSKSSTLAKAPSLSAKDNSLRLSAIIWHPCAMCHPCLIIVPVSRPSPLLDQQTLLLINIRWTPHFPLTP